MPNLEVVRRVRAVRILPPHDIIRGIHTAVAVEVARLQSDGRRADLNQVEVKRFAHAAKDSKIGAVVLAVPKVGIINIKRVLLPRVFSCQRHGFAVLVRAACDRVVLQRERCGAEVVIVDADRHDRPVAFKRELVVDVEIHIVVAAGRV